MVWIQIVTSLCALLVAATVITVVVRLIVLDKEERLRFVKSFKRGKFTFLLLVAIPLYWIGIYAAGQTTVATSFLESVEAAIELLVLRTGYAKVAVLMQTDLLYRTVMIACFVCTYLNTIMFAVSLLGQSVVNYFRVFAARFSRGPIVLLVGCNGQNLQIAESAATDKKKHAAVGNPIKHAVILSAANAEKRETIFLSGSGFIRFKDSQDLGKVVGRLFRFFGNRKIHIVINTGDDTKNVIFANQAARLIESKRLTEMCVRDDAGLGVYVFGDSENASVFEKISENTHGFVRYINKYKIIASDFWNRYPLSEFMTADHLDYETATVKPGVELNVVMIGFGETNRELFLTGVAVNQFLEREPDGKLKQKPVRYSIFDRTDRENSKNLNHSYFRYRDETKNADPADYLPIPPEPAQVEFVCEDINDREFYPTLEGRLSSDKKSVNYIFVAYGTDMENLDFSEKLYDKIIEWGLPAGTKIFVKLRDSQLCAEAVERVFTSEKNALIPFGGERQLVYCVEGIMSRSIERMARRRNFLYAVEDNIRSNTAKLIDKKDFERRERESWYGTFWQIQRESNTYACIAIRQKLLTAGFDYAPIGSPEPDASKEFFELYSSHGIDPVVPESDLKQIEMLHDFGKDYIVHYDNASQDRDSVRHTFAVQEHARWNAYMIACGVVPATRAELCPPSFGKQPALRRHGNLTTFEGLKEFRAIKAAYLNGKKDAQQYPTEKDENDFLEKADVIRYDYQIMDDVAWLLFSGGYKIIKKANG